METAEFKVGEVSTQINQNHWAWATNIQTFKTRSKAKAYAAQRWAEILDEADQAGTNFIGTTIIENY